jgi:regulatory protein YycH of two-component signal transduction system YycFG
MKLEIKYLAPYLPFKVKVIDTEAEDCIWTLHPYKDSLDCLNDNEHISLENFITENNVTKTPTHKLLLRPLSDLIKEIEINGEKFVPIVELAKLAYPDLVWEFDRTRAISEWNNELAYFFFNKNSFFACFFNNSIPNQLDLFQRLFEWHFDVFGLIDQGLALPLI